MATGTASAKAARTIARPVTPAVAADWHTWVWACSYCNAGGVKANPDNEIAAKDADEAAEDHLRGLGGDEPERHVVHVGKSHSNASLGVPPINWRNKEEK